MTEPIPMAVYTPLRHEIGARRRFDTRGTRFQEEGKIVVVELRVLAEFVLRHCPEHPCVAVQVLIALGHVDSQPIMDLRVEIFEQLPARILHRDGDVGFHLLTQALELRLDLLGRAAILVDGDDALLELHTGFDGTEHFIACAKDAGEELEFLSQQLVDPLVGCIVLV
jgi:hypothetical protein